MIHHTKTLRPATRFRGDPDDDPGDDHYEWEEDRGQERGGVAAGSPGSGVGGQDAEKPDLGLQVAALSAQSCTVWVVDEGEVLDDLVRDMTDVLTCFCARVYGKPASRNRAQKALAAAQEDT